MCISYYDISMKQYGNIPCNKYYTNGNVRKLMTFIKNDKIRIFSNITKGRKAKYRFVLP